MRDHPHTASRPMTTEEKRLAKGVREDRVQHLEQLLDEQPDLVRVRYDDGRTWLHVAAERGHVDLVQRLLKREPDLLRRTDDKGATAALLAAGHGHREVLDVLCAHGIDPKESYTVHRATRWVSGHTLMHAAASHAMPRMVQHLLDLGVPVDTPDSRGMTPLWLVSGATFAYHEFAGERPHPGMVVRALLAAGATAFRSGDHAPAKRLAALPRQEPRREAFEQKLQEATLRDTMNETEAPDRKRRSRARL